MNQTLPPDISEAAVAWCIEKIEDGQDTGAPAALVRALRSALTEAQAELHQYHLSVQLGCSIDAEIWHQLRMKMDAALGPDFDPYVRGECFAALDAIVKQRDEARVSATARAWQPIETAPKSSRAILVYCSTIKCTFGVTWDSTDGCWIHFGGRGELTEDLPSYWMPMPEAPNV